MSEVCCEQVKVSIKCNENTTEDGNQISKGFYTVLANDDEKDYE